MNDGNGSSSADSSDYNSDSSVSSIGSDLLAANPANPGAAGAPVAPGASGASGTPAAPAATPSATPAVPTASGNKPTVWIYPKGTLDEGAFRNQWDQFIGKLPYKKWLRLEKRKYEMALKSLPKNRLSKLDKKKASASGGKVKKNIFFPTLSEGYPYKDIRSNPNGYTDLQPPWRMTKPLPVWPTIWKPPKPASVAPKPTLVASTCISFGKKFGDYRLLLNPFNLNTLEFKKYNDIQNNMETKIKNYITNETQPRTKQEIKKLKEKIKQVFKSFMRGGKGDALVNASTVNRVPPKSSSWKSPSFDMIDEDVKLFLPPQPRPSAKRWREQTERWSNAIESALMSKGFIKSGAFILNP